MGVGGDPSSMPAVRVPPSGIALDEIERQAIREALKMCNWIQKDAADLLHISPRVINDKIKSLGIEMPKGRRPMMGRRGRRRGVSSSRGGPSGEPRSSSMMTAGSGCHDAHYQTHVLMGGLPPINNVH